MKTTELKRCAYCGECSAKDSTIDGACVDCAAMLVEWRWLCEGTPSPRSADCRQYRDTPITQGVNK
jgi:hypothetical protein